jgi:hypothetical protein
MNDILISALACYILGVLLCKSHVFGPFRSMFRYVIGNTPVLRWGLTLQTDLPYPLVYDDDIEGYPGETKGYDFISCRLCTGFYITGLWYIFFVSKSTISPLDIPAFLAIYGLSYFMAKMERP